MRSDCRVWRDTQLHRARRDGYRRLVEQARDQPSVGVPGGEEGVKECVPFDLVATMRQDALRQSSLDADRHKEER